MQEITLAEVLAAREARVKMQTRLLEKYRVPLIAFTMNIAGPVKNSPLIQRAFDYGGNALQAALAEAKIPVLFHQRQIAPTGCELYLAADAEAAALKRISTAIEEQAPLGRLFDMDVLDLNGQKLERREERGCIVCGAAGRGCASRRLHSVSELQRATRRIMQQHFLSLDTAQIGALATKALEDEVHTTPKPGLVDRNNSGSHRDMNLETFQKSIAALAPYWKSCFSIGQKTAALPPEDTFTQLRAAGLDAEKAMYQATNGVNTHKGAVFTLGVVCGAVGRLWDAAAPCRDVEKILRECARMTQTAAEADFQKISELKQSELTAGGRLFRRYRLRGIRGEVADGLPSVQNVSLPAFEAALAAGKSRNDAGAIALLHLIALGNDTNMIARGGIEVAAKAAEEAKTLLAQNPMPSMDEITVLDADFIRKNLSPGGCADLLAVTYFFYDWAQAS